MLKLDAISGLIKAYGAPLYSAEPIRDGGSVQAGQFTIVNDTLCIVDGSVTYYIPVRRSRIEAGINETQSFQIGVFVATRDADGVTSDGTAWSVSKGQEKVFAY